MTRDPIPVLWLCGPPGVGKTAAGWEIYRQLGRSGIAAGYADIDQLGMCYPEPPADPWRHRLKARNLGAVLATFRAAGARCAVVSGVVDSDRGVPAELLPHATLTLCRLRAGRDEVARRFTARGGDPAALGDVLRDADDMDASDVAGVCVDTTGLPVTEVARLARKRSGDWPAFPHGTPGARPGSGVLPQPARAPAPAGPQDAGAERAGRPAGGGLMPDGRDGQVLFLCGPTGVGKSAVGFEIHLRDLRAGRTAAYIDADQLGFVQPAPAGDPANHRVKARNAAALWRAYRAVGAQCLVMTGQAGDGSVVRAYAEALAPANVTVGRLHAGRAELTRRILLRGQGKSWPQPGDPLRGQPARALHRVAAEAAAEAQALERAGNTIVQATNTAGPAGNTAGPAGNTAEPAGDTAEPAAIHIVRIDTDARTMAEVADDVVARTGWPGSR
jgi:hypothetical protein